LKGSLRRCLSEQKDLVIVTVEARDVLQELCTRLQASPPAMLHLGHAAMATLLVQALNDPKESESIELQWALTGPFGNMNAYSEEFGKFRASISKPEVMSETLAMPLGPGTFQCRKVKDGIVTSGIVASQGSVNEDLEEYFDKSEQKVAAMGLSLQFEFDESLGQEQPFRISKALGYLVHLLPDEQGVSEGRIVNMDSHLRQLGPLTQWVLDHDSAMATLTMARFLSGSLKAKELDETAIEVKCRCTRDRVLNALSLLTTREKKYFLQDKDNEALLVNCEYCGKEYRILDSEI